jgi:hypothetical protein
MSLLAQAGSETAASTPEGDLPERRIGDPERHSLDGYCTAETGICARRLQWAGVSHEAQRYGSDLITFDDSAGKSR